MVTYLQTRAVSVEEMREDTKLQCHLLQFLALDLKKRESRVSTSSQEQKATNVRHTYDDGAATRLMSTVKPLRELTPSEDVIDIKPEPDEIIDEDLNFVRENPLSQKKTTVTLNVRFFSTFC